MIELSSYLDKIKERIEVCDDGHCDSLKANAPTDLKILVEMVEFYHNAFELHPDDMDMFIEKIAKHRGG